MEIHSISALCGVLPGHEFLLTRLTQYDAADGSYLYIIHASTEKKSVGLVLTQL